jgi:hypothetical protein
MVASDRAGSHIAKQQIEVIDEQMVAVWIAPIRSDASPQSGRPKLGLRTLLTAEQRLVAEKDLNRRWRKMPK